MAASKQAQTRPGFNRPGRVKDGPRLTATLKGLAPVSPAENARRMAARAKEEALAQLELYRGMMTASRVPAEIEIFPLDDFSRLPAGLRDVYADHVRRIRKALARPGALIVVSGDPGTGKTCLAASLIDERARRGQPSLWAKCSQLIRALDSCRSFSSRMTANEVLRPFRQAGLLVLDEFGRQRDGYANDEIHDLLDDRYVAERPTMLLTNKSGEEVKAAIGEWILDRMVQRGGIIELPWASLRRPEGDR